MGALAGVDMVEAPIVRPTARSHPSLQRARRYAVIDSADLGHRFARVKVGLLALERHANHHVRLGHALEQRR